MGIPSASTAMNSLLAAALVLFAATFANGQTEPWCRCALFVSSPFSEIMAYQLPELPIDTCDSRETCKKLCSDEIDTMTNGIDLWSEVNGQTVGQYICEELNKHFFFIIHNSKIHGYFELCGGAFEFTGQDSQDMLCCFMGKHEHCIVKH